MACEVCGNHISELQKYLDEHASLKNNFPESEEIHFIEAKIKELRGTESPICWGEDDCSTLMLMHCPWRIDCG